MDISMSNDSGTSNTTRAATRGRFTFRQKPLTGIQCNFAERQLFLSTTLGENNTLPTGKDTLKWRFKGNKVISVW